MMLMEKNNYEGFEMGEGTRRALSLVDDKDDYGGQTLARQCESVRRSFGYRLNLPVRQLTWFPLHSPTISFPSSSPANQSYNKHFLAILAPYELAAGTPEPSKTLRKHVPFQRITSRDNC